MILKYIVNEIMNGLKAVNTLNFKGLNKTFLVAVTTVFFVVFFNACNTVPDEKTDTRTIKDLIVHIKNSGLHIEKIFDVRYQALLANDGIVMKVDGVSAEFYMYEPSIPYQKKKLDKIKKNNSIEVLGYKFPCAVNGKFIMISRSENINKKKVVKAFKDFKLKN